MSDIQPTRIPMPDLTEANKALAKYADHIRGLRMYSEAEIEAIKAAAWDEGYDTCYDDGGKALNPYRKPTDGPR